MGERIDAIKNHSRAILAAGALGLSGMGVAVLGLGSNEKDQFASAASGVQAEDCSDLSLENNLAFENYKEGKFLPKAEDDVDSNNAAAKYSMSFFNKNGPLAGTADTESMAAIHAAVSYPASEKGSTTTSYSYVEQFNNTDAKLKSDDGEDYAKDLCETEFNVLGETAGYEEDAIADGEQYTELKAIYGKKSITGMRPVRHKADEGIDGLVYKVQNQKDDGKARLHGFTKVIVQDSGEIDVLGYLPIAKQGKNDHKDKGASHKNKDHKGEDNKNNNHGGGGKAGTGNGNGTTHNGKSPEANPGPVTGNNNQNHTGGQEHGPDHGATVGHDNTPSRGNGNGGGNTGSGNGGGNTGSGNGGGNNGGNSGGNTRPKPNIPPTVTVTPQPPTRPKPNIPPTVTVTPQPPVETPGPIKGAEPTVSPPSSPDCNENNPC